MDLPIVEVAGCPRDMGAAFGEICRQGCHELYAIRLDAAMRFARKNGRNFTEDQILDTCRECLEATRAYDPLGFEEFAGIARGADLSEAQCYALQGLTDLRDVLAFAPVPEGVGCSSFIIAPDRSQGGKLLLGQNWDLQTDNVPYVRLVHRRPRNDPETWSLTLTGCLTLIGINSEGIAVGNTNLQTTDARVGVQYLSVLHRALRARSLEEAVDAIRTAPRAGAHYYYAGGPENLAVGLECSAAQARRFDVGEGTFVHCNHALDPNIAALEVYPPGRSTRHRQERLSHLLESHKDPIGLVVLKSFLSDHDGGPNRCICRHDHADVSTNATVTMVPETGEIHACRTQPHVGTWTTKQARGH